MIGRILKNTSESILYFVDRNTNTSSNGSTNRLQKLLSTEAWDSYFLRKGGGGEQSADSVHKRFQLLFVVDEWMQDVAEVLKEETLWKHENSVLCAKEQL